MITKMFLLNTLLDKVAGESNSGWIRMKMMNNVKIHCRNQPDNTFPILVQLT